MLYICIRIRHKRQLTCFWNWWLL